MHQPSTARRQPVFAIVGRPNVGKSTLFNRLAGRPLAIVEDTPGVTRDRMYALARFSVGRDDAQVTIIDTGGFEPAPTDAIFIGVKEQTQLAIDEADVIIHVVDARAGITPDDIEVARLLRRSGRAILIAANKVDHDKHAGMEAELYRLGIPDVVPISAAHGRGISTLMETAAKLLSDELVRGALDAAQTARAEYDERISVDQALDEAEAALDGDEPAPPTGERAPTVVAVPDVLRIAVIGKPNAGKSSFVNKLIGTERHLVSEVPGTTMDAIDSFVEYGGRTYRIIDTAGIRRKRSISQRIEQFAVISALKGIDRCDIAFLLIDAVSGVTDQDLKVAAFAEEKGKAVVLVVNKWDLAQEKQLDAEVYAKQVRETIPFLSHAPIRFISAKTGKRVFDVLETALDLAQHHFRRIPTGEVNRTLKAAVDAHQPPMHAGKRVRFYFGTQVRVAPPTFVLAVSDTDSVHFSYHRYLLNQFREAFAFGGAPLRILFRERKRDDKRVAPPKREEQGRGISGKRTLSKKPPKGDASDVIQPQKKRAAAARPAAPGRKPAAVAKPVRAKAKATRNGSRKRPGQPAAAPARERDAKGRTKRGGTSARRGDRR